MRVLAPAVRNVTIAQLPVPPASVMTQLVSAPVIFTVPLGGVPPGPATVTVTVTKPLGKDGSGFILVIVVVEALYTLWVVIVLKLPR